MLKPIKKQFPQLKQFLDNKEKKYSFATKKSTGTNSIELVQVLERELLAHFSLTKKGNEDRKKAVVNFILNDAVRLLEQMGTNEEA